MKVCEETHYAFQQQNYFLQSLQQRKPFVSPPGKIYGRLLLT